MPDAGHGIPRVYHSIERLSEGDSISQCKGDDVFEVVKILAVEEVLTGAGTATRRVYTVLAAHDSETHLAPRRAE